MANKAAFTPNEWRQVVGGVFMAGFAITAADPSGLWGLLKETFAMSSQMSPTSDEPHAARARQGSAKEQTYGDGPEQCEQSFRCAAIGIVRLRAVKHERRAGRAKNLSCLKSRIIVWDRPSGADALQQPAGSRSVPRGRSVHYASTDPRAVPVSILCQRASVQKGA